MSKSSSHTAEKTTTLTSESGEARITSRNLAKRIIDAPQPEQATRALPAQTLFMAVKYAGLSSSVELIQMASIEQCKLMLDFDLWEKDSLHEESLWDWLALTDEQDDLTILQKVLKCLDLKIVSYLIARYVQVLSVDERSEVPPQEGYHTPDQGYTWIKVIAPDADKSFLLGRLMALVFETSAEVFYQLIAVTTTTTPTALVEEAYQDCLRRLQGEGVPEAHTIAQLHAPIARAQLAELLNTSEVQRSSIDIIGVQPFLYDSQLLQPLSRLISEIRALDEVEGELTLIINAACVYFAVPFYEYEAVRLLASKVKGAINIGLEIALEVNSGKSSDLLHVYERCGLQKLYRAGLAQIFSLRRRALKFTKLELEQIVHQQELFSIVAGLRELFPVAPEWFSVAEQAQPSKILSENEKENRKQGAYRAIETLREIKALEVSLETPFGDQVGRQDG
jgi:hypothetical protein